MGTISDKITYLATTKSQLKDMINNGLPTEQQITSSTTFRNYVTSIFNAFLEALRNPDTLFTNLPKKSGTGANITLNDTANAPMRITLGSTELSQDGTPTPDSPQTIHTISGSNTIKVEGKNLFDASGLYTLDRSGLTISQSNGKLFLNGTTTGLVDIYLGNDGWNANATKLKNDLNSRNTTYRLSTTSNKIANCYWNSTNGYTENVVTTTDSNKIVTLFLRINSGISFTNEEIGIQIEVGSTASDWVPYVSQTADVDLDFEFCKIGTYEDKFIKTSGKNLFDKDNNITANTGLTSEGGTFSSNDYCIKNYMEVEPNQTYTLHDNDSSKTKRICFYTSQSESSFISVVEQIASSVTFTAPSNANYMRIQIKQSELNLEILNEGSTALPYEPYGNGDWYLKQEIGKLVLDGTKIYQYSNIFGAIVYTDSSIANVGGNVVAVMSNKAEGIPINDLTGQNGIAQNASANRILIKFDGVSSYNTDELIKQYFASNNYEVYYTLATPTYTPITGTLAEQLENVYKNMLSQKGVTNISQINDDLSFNLSVQAIEDL